MFVCFFFKQKTAYEMRISDWSSDVCSSDLAGRQFAFDVQAVLVFFSLEPLTNDGAGVIPAHRNRALAVDYRLGVGARNDGVAVAIHAVEQIGRASCRERVCQYV